MFKVLPVFMAVCVLCLSSVGFSRTYSRVDYLQDSGANLGHQFGIYDPVEDYEDPDREMALLAPSPLYNPVYASYSIIVVIRKTEFQAPNSMVVEEGQRMSVYVRKEALEGVLNPALIANTQYDEASGLLFYWKTSTARPGMVTSVGHFLPEGFSSDHKSSLYNNAPMPFAVFFFGNIATHGVRGAPIKKLGGAASAGCSRLEPQRAEDLFHLIGIMGRGMIDRLTRDGFPKLNAEGLPETLWGPRTLIIVRP